MKTILCDRCKNQMESDKQELAPFAFTEEETITHVGKGPNGLDIKETVMFEFKVQCERDVTRPNPPDICRACVITLFKLGAMAV